jgi:hypothetical protein
MLLLKSKHPKVGELIYNDEILFLITDTYTLEKVSKLSLPFGYGVTGALVVPRKNIQLFRSLFVETYAKYKYKVCTLEQFKYLYKKYLFGSDGRPLKTGWDITMDDVMFKTGAIADSDRKILMPAEWIKDSLSCYFYKIRMTSYETKTTGSSPPRSTDSTGILFETFPDFIYR